MSYVEKNLIAGELVIFQTRHHWIVMAGALALGATLDLAATVGLVFLLGAAGLEVHLRDGGIALAAITLIVGLALVVVGVLKRNATEMVVTNTRVIVKTGILSRRTFEMLLSRIESIGVEEPTLGRLLGYGTVILRGVGGTPDEFDLIAQPLAFRSHVQEQIEKNR